LTNEQTNRRFRFIKKYVDFTLARSIIIGRLKRRDKPVHKRTGERDRLLLRHPALGRGGGEGRKTCLFASHFMLKMTILPGQAWDKHMESSKQRRIF
jgi:hypothetical protein